MMRTSKLFVQRFFLNLLVAVCFCFGLLLLKSSVWYLDTFADMQFLAVVYQLFSPMKGTGEEILQSYRDACFYPSIFVSLIFWICCDGYDLLLETLVLCFDVRIGKREFHLTAHHKFRRWSKAAVFCLGLFLLCFKIKKQYVLVGIPEFVDSLSNSSELYEQYYVNPQETVMSFPQKKRNLLLIYMESMESTYASMDEGTESYNYIPGLTRLAKENVSFSDDEDLGGAYGCDGTGWTMAALLASVAGVNYKLPINGNTAGEYQSFLKGLTTLGDILNSAGYQNYFMCGSDAEYAGRRDFYEQHGDYEILDYGSAMKEGIIAENYHVFWGMEDRYLYEYAQKKLPEIANCGEPFNLTMLTVDTHALEGYVCELCGNEYSTQYANVFACADRQICDFLDWAKEQEWYEDTTIVITGDHYTMTPDFVKNQSGEKRTIYNCFLNLPERISAVRTNNRVFSVLDLFPTILASMGVKIEGERLGLGTNLFSAEETLPEQLGWDTFNEELRLYSNYYFNHFIIGER